MIETLDEVFKSKKLPYHYNLSEVDRLLKTKYGATEADRELFSDLKLDSAVNFDRIVACYQIDDLEVLDSIFTSNERYMHQDAIEAQKTRQSSEDNARVQMWLKIQRGELINIVLESANGDTLSAFTMQGMSETILNDLYVLRGIDSDQCYLGNETYEMYLQILNKAGYL